MPDQPTTEAQVAPQVSPSAELPMAFTPDALGSEVGQAIATAGEVSVKLHHDAVQRANETAILDGDNRTNEFLSQRLYDAKTGILHQQLGQDAPAAVDQVLTDFDKHTATVSAGMANDQQRLSYQRMAVNRRFDLERQLGTYEHGEVTRAQQETRQSAVAARTTTAVQSAAADPDRALQAMLEGKAIIADDGRGKHQSDDVIRERQTEFASATHLGVLENLTATGNDRFAQTWYDAHKDELTGKDATMAARLVEAGSLAGEATRQSDKLVYAPDGGVRLRADIDKDIRAITDPKLRDAVQTRADEALARHHREVEDDRRAQMENAYGVLNDPNGQGPYDPRFVAATATMPAHDRDELIGSWQKRVDPIKVDRELAGAAADPDAFLAHMRSDGPKLLIDLGPQGYAKLQAAEKEIQQKGQLGNSAEIFTKANVVDQALGNAGFARVTTEGGTALDRDNPAAQAFLGQLQARFDIESRGKGRALTPDEMQKVADQMTIQARVRPAGTFGYGSPTPVFRLTPEQRGTATGDLAQLAKTNPSAAENERQYFARKATEMGVRGDSLSESALNRAYGQKVIAQDLAAQGDRAGARAAMDEAKRILRENATPIRKTGAGPGPGDADYRGPNRQPLTRAQVNQRRAIKGLPPQTDDKGE